MDELATTDDLSRVVPLPSNLRVGSPGCRAASFTAAQVLGLDQRFDRLLGPLSYR